MYLTNKTLSNFSTKSWVFTYGKRLWLRTQVPPCDSKHFQLDGMETFDYKSFLKKVSWGVKLYLLKESTDIFPHERRHSIR
jgi:hypothetical protein